MNINKKVSKLIEDLKEQSPLIHCITNVVTVRDCANATLAVGASPIMANEPDEAIEITTIANGLVINIGTLIQDQIKTMKKSATTASKLNKPFVLDPVGVGISNIRNQTTLDIIDIYTPTIIRGNISEIKAIANLLGILEEITVAKGVDVADSDKITEDNIETYAELIRQIADKLNTTVAVSGPIDIISDGDSVYTIDNGDIMLSRITGTGCMLASIMGSYLTITNPLDAAITATVVMGLAGELAADSMRANNQGSGSFGVYLIDELNTISSEIIEKLANIQKVI